MIHSLSKVANSCTFRTLHLKDIYAVYGQYNQIYYIKLWRTVSGFHWLKIGLQNGLLQFWNSWIILYTIGWRKIHQIFQILFLFLVLLSYIYVHKQNTRHMNHDLGLPKNVWENLSDSMVFQSSVGFNYC